MRYLSSYVQGPLSVGVTNNTPGPSQVAHRRRNRVGGYSAPAILTGVTFPNTVQLQGYSDPQNLESDELLVRLGSSGPWRKVPAALTEIPTVPPSTWELVTEAELVGNQGDFELPFLDFGAFSAASEPSRTLYLLNDGTDTIETLNLAVLATTGGYTEILDGRVSLQVLGVLGTKGVGNPVTTFNTSVVYSSTSPSTVPLVLGPGQVAIITLSLVNFPATGLVSTDIEAEIILTPNRGGFPVPAYLSWQPGHLLATPGYTGPLLVLREGLIWVQPFQVRVGSTVWIFDTEFQSIPVGTGSDPLRLVINLQGFVQTLRSSEPVPDGSVVLAEMDEATGTAYRTLAPWNPTSLHLRSGEPLEPGLSVKIDANGELVAGVPTLGVSVQGSGNFAPSGPVRVQTLATVALGASLSAGADGVWVLDPLGPAVALEAGTGLVQAFLKPGTGSGGGGGGSVDLGYVSSATTGTVTNTGGTNAVIPLATVTNSGLLAPAEKTKLSGIATGAQVNVPTNLGYGASSVLGTVTSSTGASASIPVATEALVGLMGPAQVTKLLSVETGAQANAPTDLGFTTFVGGGTVTSSTGLNATIPNATTLVPGLMAPGDKDKLDNLAASTTDLAAVPQPSLIQVTNSNGTGFNLTSATGSQAGLLTPSAFNKLVGIAAGAQVNVPTNLGFTASPTMGQVTSSTGTSATVPLATETNSGLLDPAEKTKLSGIATGAQVNVPTNLGFTASPTTGQVTSSTGTSATVPLATGTNSGLLSPSGQGLLAALNGAPAALGFGAGWSHYNPPANAAPGVLKVGRVCFLTGVAGGGPSTLFTSTVVVPVGFRPPKNVVLALPCDGGLAIVYLDAGDGGVKMLSFTGNPSSYISLNGFYLV